MSESVKQKIARRFKLKKLREKEQGQLDEVRKKTAHAEDLGWSMGAKGSNYKMPDSVEDLGIDACQILQAYALSAKNNSRRASVQEIPKILADNYDNKYLSNLVEKDYETSSPEQGGQFLIPQVLWQEFIPHLRCNAPIMALGARILPMKSGISIPGMANGTSAEYFGEKQAPLLTSSEFNDIKLDPKKLGTKTCISEDLLEESDFDVLSKIREDITAAMSEKMTNQMLYGQGSKYAPAGLEADQKIQRIDHGGQFWTTDLGLCGLQYLWEECISFASFENTGWMINPRLWKNIAGMLTTTGAFLFKDEMVKEKTILGSPFKMYQGIPVTEIAPGSGTFQTDAYFGMWSEYIIGVTKELRVQVSDEAAFLNNAGEMCSAWDIGAVLLRLTQKHDFALRRSKAFVKFENIRVA